MSHLGNGQVGPRGWIVVALVVIVSAVAGWNMGGARVAVTAEVGR